MGFSTSFLGARMVSTTTRGMKFLTEMEQVLPRTQLTKEVNQRITKASTGRPRYDTSLMLKIYFLQLWYNLSDPWVEDAIYDRVSFQKFLDLDLLADSVPDETSILNFRHFLEQHRLQERIFRVINRVLDEKGLLVKEGTTVDATIIHAPSSTKNKDGERDSEMASTKKWHNYHFGMKVHVWTDSSSGLIHTLECTAANVHDVNVMDDLMHGEEQVVYGDSAYMSKEKYQSYTRKGIAYHVCKRWARYRKLEWLEKQMNHVFSQVRARGERAFRVIKQLWQHRKVRYRWIDKNRMQWYALAGLANVYMMRKKLLAS